MRTFKSTGQQGGFVLLLSAVITLSISAALMTLHIDSERKIANKLRAVEAGVQLRAFNYGVMRLISDLGPTATAGTYVGTGWLKLASCSTPGTSTVAYLPCSFPDTNRYRDTYTTVLSVSGSNVEATISVPWPKVLGNQSAKAASTMRQTAASDNSLIGEYGVTITPAVLGWVTFKDVVETSISKTVESTASNNAALDVWLRRDGSNKFAATLDMDGNDITNVGSLDASGTIEAATFSATSVLFDSINSQGGVDVAGFVNAVDGITTGNNVDALGNLLLGDGANNTSILFRQSGNPISMTAEIGGDLIITNTAGNAQLIADKVYIKDVNRFASQAVYNLSIVPNNGRIDVITCPAGTTEQVFTAVSGLSNNVPESISAFDVVTTTVAGTPDKWNFEVQLITSSGRVASGSVDANILVVVKCS